MSKSDFFKNYQINAPDFIKDIYPKAKEVYVFAFLPFYVKRPTDYKIGLSGLGEDYHLVLKEKIENTALNTFCFKKGDYEILVDYQKFDEKKLAVIAKAGFITKNNLLYSPEAKGFPYLGELITFTDEKNYNSECFSIKPDDFNFQSTKEICKKCTACQLSCPASSLTDNGYQKDTCISFLTQKGGILNQKEMVLIGENIYGCDLCQDVCPINDRKAHQYLDYSLPNLYFLATLTKDSFNEIKTLPFAWIGRVKLKRNAIICAYNKNLPELFLVLEQAKNDPSSIIKKTSEIIYYLCSKKH